MTPPRASSPLSRYTTLFRSDPLSRIGGLVYELDDDLLSHGEAPHYHRRCVVSLLSSGWDQVVPTLYGRQAIRDRKSTRLNSIHVKISYRVVCLKKKTRVEED